MLFTRNAISIAETITLSAEGESSFCRYFASLWSCWLQQFFWRVESISQCCCFPENALVGVMLFFEEFNLKGSWEKEKFFESLPNVLRETIPCKAQVI